MHPESREAVQPAPILRSQAGAVLVLTLNRPGKRNALDDHARRELAEQLEAARADRGIRAIVLSGAAGFFCAGADIGAMSQQPGAAQARMPMLTRLAQAILRCPKPVIAAVEGGASGLGLALAAACDHVIAAENARFTASFGRLGLVGDTGLFWSLTGRLGPARARQFLLFDESVAAPEAADIGLVNELAGPGDVQRIALARAGRLAEASAPALARLLRTPQSCFHRSRTMLRNRTCCHQAHSKDASRSSPAADPAPGYTADVRDRDRAQEAVDAVISRFGRVDHLTEEKGVHGADGHSAGRDGERRAAEPTQFSAPYGGDQRR